jgi:hypothetical protein
VPFAALLDYWLGDLDDAREEAIERHLFGCGECCASLERIVELAGGIRTLLRRGELATAVTPAFVEALSDSGLRLRQYGVPCNGSVHCTIAPDDDLLVTRLQASLAGVERLDLVMHEAGEHALQRLTDIPFSAAAGEVVLLPRVDRIRALGESIETIRLIAVGSEGERVIGEYRFLHAPWPGA